MLRIVVRLHSMPEGGDQSGKPEPKSIGEWIGDALGVRFPKLPQTLKNLDKAGGALLDIPAAWAASKAQRIRGQADRKEKLDNALAKALTQRLAKSSPEEVAQRVDGMLIDYLEKHASRKRVLELAVQELEQDPPKEDAKEPLSDDWMAFFKGKVDALGTDDVRVLFSKVLAGEVRQPGSFSKKTLSVLAELDQPTAQLFERFCNMTAVLADADFRIIEPPDGDGLEELGFPFSAIAALADAGLTGSEPSYGSESDFKQASFEIAGTKFNLTAEGRTEDLELHGPSLSTSGRQLRSIVALKPDPAYIDKLTKALADKGLKLTPQKR